MLWGRWITGVSVVGALGCGSSVPIAGETDTDSGGSGDSSTSSTSTTSTSTTTTTQPPPTVGPPDTDTQSSGSTTRGTTTGPPGFCADGICQVDIVVVVDNSGTMAIEQAQLGAAMLPLAAGLEERGYDAQVMFTTTDFGNPACDPFKPQGYTPARGAPITTPCTDRIQDFTGLGADPDVVPEACEQTCPVGVAPTDDPFVALGPDGANVPAIAPTDIDGDGVEDSAAAQAMACMAPQGINGCGFESPLENMIQALDPLKPWNTADRPFLRDGATVALLLMTDEADCSVRDFSVMDNEEFQELDPQNGEPFPSSAICWNAGVECVGPDASGVFSSCVSSQLDLLQPVSRYTEYLSNLRNDQGKEVVMLGVVGIPPVEAHAAEVPQTPVIGGVLDLAYRNWRDGEFPRGDILPDEFAGGVTAEDKRFLFKIGPGCTGGDAANGFTGQAIPPVRVREVCESLNVGGGPADVRCCLESVCDGDYAPAMGCLLSMLDNVAG